MLSSFGYPPDMCNTYISLTIYINKFQNVKSEGRIVRRIIQLSLGIGGLC